MNSNKFLRLFLCLIVLICTASNILMAQHGETQGASDFSYLNINNSEIVSTHAIKYSLSIPEGFTIIQPLNHKPSFNNHTFNVSVAALIKEKNIIVVHAEKVTDGSDFLDYSYLKPVKLNGLNFYMQENCLELSAAQIEQAADIKYIKERGFDFGKAMYSRQFFTNTPDGTYEYVLTFGERICDCSDETVDDDFIKRFDQTLESVLLVKELE